MPVRIFDTAGMRKKAKVQDKLEKLSVGDGLRAVKFAEVVVVLLDAGASSAVFIRSPFPLSFWCAFIFCRPQPHPSFLERIDLLQRRPCAI